MQVFCDLQLDIWPITYVLHHLVLLSDKSCISPLEFAHFWPLHSSNQSTIKSKVFPPNFLCSPYYPTFVTLHCFLLLWYLIVFRSLTCSYD